MCGITGFIDHNSTSTPEVLRAMTASLRHRGPEAEGDMIVDHGEYAVGLGHRRLRIIDLSEGGAQPMTFGPLTITFNGEIYNYAALREELSKMGHSFKSRSDTEVILHAFSEWGEQCVKRFTGMFAFAIYDSEKRTLTCVRDRAGVKPFFYYEHDGLFLFASELKAFHQHPHFVRMLNTDAVGAYLQFGNVPAPHCIFRHCHKLQPGHVLKVDVKSGKSQLTRYWNVYDHYNRPKEETGFTEARAKTERILKAAFEYRMVADVPVGVFLSGGYDSACVAALLQQGSGRKLRTFTIGVPDIGLNEAPFAKAIAQHLGTDHSEYYCTGREATDLIDDLPYYYDEPFADSSAIPTMLLSRMARQSVTVALSGDGGDEIFAGYNRYAYLMKFGRMLNAVPSGLRKTISFAMEKAHADKLPWLKDRYNFANRYEKLKLLLNDASAGNIMLNLSRQYSDEGLAALLRPEIMKLATAYDSQALKSEYYSPLAYMMAIDYETYLPDDILQKVDRASMSVSLELREPFLDQGVIEWAARLPDSYKYHKGEKKYILKEIVHQYIPRKLMERPKMGFAVPIESWLNGVLRDYTEQYLSESSLRNSGVLEPAQVKKIMTDFYAGRKELGQKVWYLLMFQMWYERWMK
jgi:asparagine synthase (glutamine-hydrolysing)